MSDNPLDEYILSAVKIAGRNYQRGVLPRMVQPLLPVPLSEQRVRLYMVRLWKAGKLVRIGATVDGNRTRQGYRVPNQVEMKLEQDLFELLHCSQIGVKLAELCRYIAAAEDTVQDYLSQMAACGRVVLAVDDVRLPAFAEVA